MNTTFVVVVVFGICLFAIFSLPPKSIEEVKACVVLSNWFIHETEGYVTPDNVACSHKAARYTEMTEGTSEVHTNMQLC